MPRTNLIHNLYTYDNGEGGYVDYLEPFPLGMGLTTQVINSRQALTARHDRRARCPRRLYFAREPSRKAPV